MISILQVEKTSMGCKSFHRRTNAREREEERLMHHDAPTLLIFVDASACNLVTPISRCIGPRNWDSGAV